MPSFVDEIELLKNALATRKGTRGTASRRIRQAGETVGGAVGRARMKLDEGVEKVMNARLVPGGETPKARTAAGTEEGHRAAGEEAGAAGQEARAAGPPDPRCPVTSGTTAARESAAGPPRRTTPDGSPG